ncbi:hypothetical protein SAMN05421770_102216 [Granulicella rosea]|uniref:Uncharacterized protein n=1 Tax=Granulicella rosea TaxID=474952 RepID=A0A239H4K4_9BACT|nr:hypothetical protein [Granulicella rosea]SNS76085.1 hypothetical protein SAMN05421770_102216 [Granulicella rosea]
MRLFSFAGLSLCLALTTGCHSAYIAATISNHTSQPLSVVEVDYPSASFGTQTLAPGADFHYRFKVLGSGELKLLYTDAAHTDHHAAGPHLNEGDEGALGITISAGDPAWDLKLVNRK